MNRTRLILALLALLPLLAACDPPPRPTQNTSAEPRIAVLSPALAASLMDLGLDRFVVGRHAWDLALSPQLPVVGDTVGGGVDYENLLRTNPTHVVVQLGASPAPQRLLDLAAQYRWTLLRLEPLSWSEVLDAAGQMARSVGHEAPARLEEIRARADRILATRPQRAGVGPILLLASLSPPSALGPRSVHHDLLCLLGATPAITTGAPYQTLDAEDLRTLSPAAIVIFAPRARNAAPAQLSSAQLIELLGPSFPKDVPAIIHRRLALLDDPLALLPATTLLDTAQQLADQIDRWAPPQSP